MRIFRSIPMFLALSVSTAFISGCPKQDEVETIAEVITDPAVYFNRAVTTLQTPDKTGAINYAGAYEDFKLALGLAPTNPKILFNAGWTAERLGKADEAEQHYRNALQADAAYNSALVNLANLLVESKRFDEAVTIYEGYVNGRPTDLEARNSLAEALAGAGRFDEAISQIQSILLVDPQNVQAYRNLSQVYFAKGDYAMSQLAAEKAITLNNADPGIYNNVGVTYLKQGNQPAAIDAFRTAIKLDPTNVEANLNLGYVALDSGDYAQAQECFSAVIKAKPENIDALLGLAVALRGMKDLDGAGKLYEQLLEMAPDNELAYFNAATFHERYTKDFKKALAILEKYQEVMAGKLGPDHEVFVRIDRVKQSQIEEDKRIAAEKQKLAEAEERKKRQMAQLDDLKKRTDGFKKKMEQANCPVVAETGMLEEFKMVVEQADTVIQQESFADAADMITFLESMEPMLDELIPQCGGAPAPEGAPTPEGAPAPEGATPTPPPGG